MIQNQQPKIDNVISNKNNRTLITGFSNSGKTYVMKYNLLQKQEPFFIRTKSLNQYPNIKAQTSDQIQPMESYENSPVVFGDMLLSEQASNIDLFFPKGRHSNLVIYFISQIYFQTPKHTIPKSPNEISLIKQTPRQIILLFHGIGV